MFPDVLVPLPASTVRAVPGQWRALWVQICIDRDMRPGNYAVTVSVLVNMGKSCGKAVSYTHLPFLLTGERTGISAWTEWRSKRRAGHAMFT